MNLIVVLLIVLLLFGGIGWHGGYGPGYYGGGIGTILVVLLVLWLLGVIR